MFSKGLLLRVVKLGLYRKGLMHAWIPFSIFNNLYRFVYNIFTTKKSYCKNDSFVHDNVIDNVDDDRAMAITKCFLQK